MTIFGHTFGVEFFRIGHKSWPIPPILGIEADFSFEPNCLPHTGFKWQAFTSYDIRHDNTIVVYRDHIPQIIRRRYWKNEKDVLVYK